jgi:hypothetical protein
MLYLARHGRLLSQVANHTSTLLLSTETQKQSFSPSFELYLSAHACMPED